MLRKDLTCGPDRNVFLLRMDAGARGRKHTHAHVEHCYVIEGDVSIVGLQLGAGDHHIAGKGTVHDGLTTDRGCLLLLAESLV